MNDSAAAMPIRKMEFGFDDDIDLFFFDNDPVLSYGSHAYWMTMPYLEPYLMRTVRSAMAYVNDVTLLEAMRRFCSQEGQHYQQHAKVNAILKRRVPDAARLTAIETELEADYKRFSSEREPAFNLAYAEAFESMTLAMSCTQMEMRVQDMMTAPIRDLFLWHITEEMEHRTVAFDAYERLGNGYWYRLSAGRAAQRHYLGYVRRFLECFLEIDSERVRAAQTQAATAARERFQREFARRNGPRMRATLMPWYHPSKIRLPDGFDAARAHYSARAVSIA